MRSDKMRDISMNFDSIAATSLDVSYGDSVTSASDPMEIADRLAGLEGLPATQIAIRETVLEVGPLELDLIERTAERAGRTIDLLPKEFRLLRYMMQHSDLLLTRRRLLEEVWHYRFIPKTNLVDVHMGRLRHKVNGPNETPMIHSIRGAGFILRTPC
jgi:two-component system, OmpR family, response regulator